MNNRINIVDQDLPLRMEVDVLVAGGGPAGIIAAMAAAGEGMRVAVIESRSFLGGNLVTGLPILGFLGQKGNQIITGLPQRFMDRLASMNAVSRHRPCPLHVSITLVEPEAVKAAAFEMLKESGTEVLLYTTFSDVIMEEGQLKGVIIDSKAGREKIMAKVIIDCTGDADVAYRAGVPCEKGNEQGGMQPPTLMFSMGDVDTDKLRMAIAESPGQYPTDFIPASYFGENDQYIVVGLRNLVQKAKQEGLTLPADRTIIITGLTKGEAWINMTRVNGVDGTDPVSLTQGEWIARQQIGDIVRYLNQYVPGFENATIFRTAPFLGIRETRRIVGHYILTREDILSQARFDDAVAVASYPLDIHHPTGGDCTLEWSGDCYDIPYRSLLPLNVENLLVAGRSISTTHEAMSSIRVMAPCMAMGEAAGRAARMAVREGVSPSRISVNKLRKELMDEGAYLRS